MTKRLKFGCVLWFIFTFVALKYQVLSFRCDRRPYGSMTQPSAPDGRFKLEVVGTEDSYIPGQLYTVQIIATDDKSFFTGFVISAEGDTKVDPKNPRRMIALYPGDLRPQDTLTAKFSDRCLYAVEQAIASTKSSVVVYWQAPESGNGCVILRAMVAENEEVWFQDGSPLTQRLCEDMSQPDDVTPILNFDCQTCDEAKYELTFTGIWSRNTHPRLYPENDWLPRFSDLVGASHDTSYVLWMPDSLVTDGFKDFAEYANSSKLEAEIRENIGSGVRTMIKGKGHSFPKMGKPTYAFFRADKTNHLFTVAVALDPSPDWFLGVTRYELCQDNTWLAERELRLYPWDAGTDSGVSYESANIVTYPQDAVSRVAMSSYDRNSPFYETDMKDLHPFGKLNIKLIRTYHKECVEETTTEEASNETSTTTESQTETTTVEAETGLSEPDEPASETPLVTDPDSSEYCPLTEWLEWNPCDGICENGKMSGFRWRERYHLVDGVAVEKYDPNVNKNKHAPKKEVPKFCKEHYTDYEIEDCNVDCSDKPKQKQVTAGRRIMDPVAPGHSWTSKKRRVPY
ncbi:spondin-1-like isoform X2 [Epargyreus clarus]|uniref:spondin-1-like isoform X2 n=1 Tax=Epargyreus clarus TaxID=520877 RepID=UPI003C2B197F